MGNIDSCTCRREEDAAVTLSSPTRQELADIRVCQRAQTERSTCQSPIESPLVPTKNKSQEQDLEDFELTEQIAVWKPATEGDGDAFPHRSPVNEISTFTGKAKVKYLDNNKYTGFLQNGIKHGYGNLVLPNGDHYTGYFNNGRFEGFGSYVWKDNQNRFVGEWKLGKMHGTGKMIYSNGDFYQGQYTHGKREGNGIFYDHNKGISYTGQWKDGEPHGDGIIKTKNEYPVQMSFKQGQIVKQVGEQT